MSTVYSLVRIADGVEVRFWRALPGAFRVPETRRDVHAAFLGWTDGEYKIVEREYAPTKDEQIVELERNARPSDRAVREVLLKLRSGVSIVDHPAIVKLADADTKIVALRAAIKAEADALAAQHALDAKPLP